MENLLPTQWIAQFAQRLQERWRTIDQAVLEEVAMDLWKRTEYRVMSPQEAADVWLNPIAPAQPSGLDPSFAGEPR
jgi:hypothetical protein